MTRILLLFFLFAFSQAKAQNKIITGTVKNADGPMPGVSVSVEGTGAGTQTDSNGNFRISAAANATLLISYVGYEAKKGGSY